MYDMSSRHLWYILLSLSNQLFDHTQHLTLYSYNLLSHSNSIPYLLFSKEIYTERLGISVSGNWGFNISKSRKTFEKKFKRKPDRNFKNHKLDIKFVIGNRKSRSLDQVDFLNYVDLLSNSMKTCTSISLVEWKMVGKTTNLCTATRRR